MTQRTIQHQPDEIAPDQPLDNFQKGTQTLKVTQKLFSTAKKSATRPRPPVHRQLPRPKELAELLQFRKPTLDPVQRRLEAALTIEDLRRIAAKTTPRSVFDYVDGAADSEITVRRNQQALRMSNSCPRASTPSRIPISPRISSVSDSACHLSSRLPVTPG